MAKCTKCGREVATPKKTWMMAGRPDRMGRRTQLEIAIFDCPQCKKSFRAVIGKKKI